MANHKDAKKRARQNIVRREHNKHFRSKMRNQIKQLNAALEEGDVAAAEAQLPNTVSMIDRVERKGIIHRKQAARRVGRLTRAVNALKAGGGEAASAE